MRNIDKFDIYSGKILALLLIDFPIAKDIDVFSDIIRDENATDNERKFVYHTMKALKEYGFITYQSADVGGELFIGVRLSLKAL